MTGVQTCALPIYGPLSFVVATSLALAGVFTFASLAKLQRRQAIEQEETSETNLNLTQSAKSEPERATASTTS